MILTGPEIKKEIESKRIVIEPYEERFLNPNSYNLRLYSELLEIKEGILDMKKPTEYKKVVLTDEGFVLQPGKLYLGRTLEYTESHSYLPMLEGRSSIGRLGIFIHATAGFGDVGFCGYWTLEISVVQPVRIYPDIPICQIFYNDVKGELMPYKGKYQRNEGIQVSGIYREFMGK